MSISPNMRKLLLTMALVVGMVAVAVPACQMVACGMTGSGMITPPGPILKGVCEGLGMSHATPVGSLPPSSESLILTLIVAFAATVVLLDPPRASILRFAFARGPDSPPEDPRGVRLLL